MPLKITIIQCRMLRDRYDDGETLPELAADVGVANGTMYRHLTGECKHATEWQALGREDMTGSVATDHSIRNMSPLTRILADPEVTTLDEARRLAEHRRGESA